MNWEMTYAILGSIAATVAVLEFIHRVVIKNETQDVTIKKQPLRVQEETALVSISHLDLTLENYASKEDLNDTERRLDLKINNVATEQETRANDRGMKLQEKLDEKFSEAIAASNSSASKVHQRIDKLAEKQGELIGEIKHLTAATQNAATSSQQAATVCMSCQNRK